MSYWTLLVILALPLVLTGWLIGRGFVKPSKFDAPARPVAKIIKIEFLVANLNNGDWRINSEIERFIKSAVRELELKAETPGAFSGRRLDVRLRSIGKWTFAPSNYDRDLDQSLEDEIAPGSGMEINPSQDPGTAFLLPHQIVVQPFRAGDSKDLQLTFHANRPDRKGAVSGGNNGFELYGVTLQDWFVSGQDANRLMAFMFAYLSGWQSGSRSGSRSRSQREMQLNFIQLADKYIDQSSDKIIHGIGKSRPDNAGDPSWDASRGAVSERDWQNFALEAYINAVLGQHLGELDRINHALTIYRTLLKSISGTKSAVTRRSGRGRQVDSADQPDHRQAMLRYDAARVAVASFELSGRNPERLLEADEYCRMMLKRSGFFQDQGLVFDLHLLRTQILRLLALHDGSLTGLERAHNILNHARGGVEAEAEYGRESITRMCAELDLEEGRLHQACGQISGNLGNIIEAINSYNRVIAPVNSETGAAGASVREARFGLGQCLIELGKTEEERLRFRTALKILDEGISAGTRFHTPAFKPTSSTSDDEFKLVKARALAALGALDREVECLEQALVLISGLSQTVRRHGAGLMETIVLDMADITNSTTHYDEAVTAIRLARTDGTSRNISVRQYFEADNWRINTGFVEALSILSERHGNLSLLLEAEAEVQNLAARSRDEVDELRLAQAEHWLGRLLEKKSDMTVGGDADALVEAVRMRRRALDMTPRATMPALWAERQAELGGLLAKLGVLSGDLAGLEGAVRAYKKSLDENRKGSPVENSAAGRVAVLQRLGQTLKTLSDQTGDPKYRSDARTAFEQAYDAGQANNLVAQVRMAESALACLNGETLH